MGRKVEVGTSWAEVSSVACQYQLQAGDRVMVATGTVAPLTTDEGIYVIQGEINHFEPNVGKKLWAKAYYSSSIARKAYYSSSPFARIVVDEV